MLFEGQLCRTLQIFFELLLSSLKYMNNRVVAVQKENKRKFAEKENIGLIERLVIMDERKVLKDL